ncbi:hypothetical protein [Catenovulum sediminis]|uniref:Uncharacterized protein n=1 Tax=Catenovulum sediminis TaxID=1740262 RepID=A0ABV1RLT8_9ALTE
MLKRLAIDGVNGEKETFSYEYDLSQQVDPLCKVTGEDEDHNGACYNYIKRPQTKIIHKRFSTSQSTQSDTYTTEKVYALNALTGEFIDYGYPNKITQYSSLQPEQRVIDLEYKHITASNIIGLLEKVTKNDKEIVYNTYNNKGQK